MSVRQTSETLAPTSPTESSPFINGRRTPRRAFNRPIGVLLNGVYRVFRARQLSEGGLLFEVSPMTPLKSLKPQQGNADFESVDIEKEFAVGASLVISLLLPDGVGIIVRGKTIYHERSKAEGAERDSHSDGKVGIGVKFDAVALNHRRAIRNFVSSKPVGELER